MMLSKVRFLIRLNGHQFGLLNSIRPASGPASSPANFNSSAKFSSRTTSRLLSTANQRSLSSCVNRNSQVPQEADLYKKCSLLAQRIREHLQAANKLDSNAAGLLNSLENVCAEMKELQSQFEGEDGNEIRDLMQDDLSNLNEKFDRLKDVLIERLYTESYLTDELTMEFENGVGGNEAMIFTKELVNFYTQYCRKRDWAVSPVDLVQSNDVDGYLNCTLKVVGQDCFKWLRHEAGVHRVQRIPTTDKMNRVHTSTIAIKVVPIFKESEIDLSPRNLEIDTMRGTGPGGQLVNKRESTVRIVHIPTGVAIKCGEQRDQEENKRIALHKLRLKLSDMKFKAIQEEEAKIRSNQVRSVMRSEKIRTFNFPQDRITDHRIKKDISNIKGFFTGACNQSLSAWIEEINESHNARLREEVLQKLDCV